MPGEKFLIAVVWTAKVINKNQLQKNSKIIYDINRVISGKWCNIKKG